MSSEVQKTIVNQFFHKVLKEGRIEFLEEILDPACSYIDDGKLIYTTREDFSEYVQEARKPFTRVAVIIDEMIAEGDKVAVRCRYILETERDRTTVSVMGFFLFSDGKIVKIWRNIVVINQ